MTIWTAIVSSFGGVEPSKLIRLAEWTVSGSTGS
jgi:hypothetical protein